MNQLNEIIGQLRDINLKEIRNLKIPEDSCLSEKETLSDFICSVCLEIVEDPVSCSQCEKLNCRECINFNQASIISLLALWIYCFFDDDNFKDTNHFSK